MAVISIVGARGGAGCSTLGLNLARSLIEAGRTVRLIDEELWLVPDVHQFDVLDPDHVVVPLCRHSDSPWLMKSDQIVLVVPAEVRAVANAAKILPQLERHALCSLVVRLPSPSSISASKIEALLNIPLAAVIKSEAKVATLGEHAMTVTKSMKKSVSDLIEFLGLH